MTSSPYSPFDDLREALKQGTAAASGIDQVAALGVRLDPGRWRRTGIPEVVHAEAKSIDLVVTAVRRLAEAQGRVTASRVRDDMACMLREALEPELVVDAHPLARSLIAAIPGAERPNGGGTVGILSAGSSDIPIAAEAALMASEMGATVLEAWDVGVAGLQRLVEPLERFAAERVDAIVVAAGMDGALPAVVAGLVDVPVIGLPTSVGYGFGGGGVGALTTMLQSCAPGLVVVNIDNGIGAGSTAALIANRAADSRKLGRDQVRGDEIDGPAR
jgi:NCAIR mutase (PurE)-related protein